MEIETYYKHFKDFMNPYSIINIDDSKSLLSDLTYEQKNSLVRSFFKWYLIVFEEGRDFGWINCDFCLKQPNKIFCIKCLIFNLTKETNCRGTPYEDWLKYQNIICKVLDFNLRVKKIGLNIVDDLSRRHATQELIFFFHLCTIAEIDEYSIIMNINGYDCKKINKNLKTIPYLKQFKLINPFDI